MRSYINQGDVARIVSTLSVLRNGVLALGVPRAHQLDRHIQTPGIMFFANNDIFISPQDDMISLGRGVSHLLRDSYVFLSSGFYGVYGTCGRILALSTLSRTLKDPFAGTAEQIWKDLAEVLVARRDLRHCVDIISGLASVAIVASEIEGAADVLSDTLDLIEDICCFDDGLHVRISHDWQVEGFSYSTDVRDLGTAHGLAGLVLLYAQVVYRYGGERAPILYRAVEALRLHIGEEARFPNRAGEPPHPQPAWCYGPLMAGFALSLAGRVLAEGGISACGDRLVRNVLSVNVPEMRKLNSSLCHGRAGVFHIAHRFAELTEQDSDFRLAAVWLKGLLDGIEEGHVPEVGYVGYLNDDVGIGLALQTALYPDLTWDHFLFGGRLRSSGTGWPTVRRIDVSPVSAGGIGGGFTP